MVEEGRSPAVLGGCWGSQPRLVKLPGEGEEVLASLLAEAKFLGTVVTFKPKCGYGFIRSEQIDTDVFFGFKQVCFPSASFIKSVSKKICYWGVHFYFQ